MLSELATNAVQHAATEFEVAIRIAPDRSSVRVDVSDGAADFPLLPEQVSDAPRGRGLHIVRGLADAWGVEMRRDRPGKTVWFSLPLTTGAVDAAPATDVGAGTGSAADLANIADGRTPTTPMTRPPQGQGTPPSRTSTRSPPPGPRQRHRRTVSRRGPCRACASCSTGCATRCVATDEQGRSATSTPRPKSCWAGRRGTLVGRPVFDLVPESLAAAVGDDYERLRPAPRPRNLVGRPLDVDVKRADGTDVATELVISIFDHPLAGPVVVGILRPRDEKKLQRWSELTSELLEILADAPIDEPPEERLLSTLGRRLDWDVTTLWTFSAARELVCRHVWTRTPSIAPAFALEKAGDPTSGSEGLPRWVLEHGEALWVADSFRTSVS